MQYVKFKKGPFKYIPKVFVKFIMDNADMFDPDCGKTYKGLDGISGFLAKMIIYNDDEVHLNHKDFLAVMCLVSGFIYDAAPEIAEERGFEPGEYVLSGAYEICAYILRHNNLDAETDSDSYLLVRISERKQAVELLSEYVNVHLEECVMPKYFELKFDDIK